MLDDSIPKQDAAMPGGNVSAYRGVGVFRFVMSSTSRTTPVPQA